MKKVIKRTISLILILISIISFSSCSFLESIGIKVFFGDSKQTTTTNPITEVPTTKYPTVSQPTVVPTTKYPTESQPTEVPTTKYPTASQPTEVPTTKHPTETKSTVVSTTTEPKEKIVDNIIYDDFQIHFLELGVYNTGDSTYIKAGDVDILIDAGAIAASALTIIDYVDDYCEDGVLEYVITTHAHDDHYTGMFGNSKATTNFKGEAVSRTGILYYYEVETLIDFSYSNNVGKSNYNKYEEAVTYAVNKGTKHYTAEDCFLNENGGQRSFVLDKNKNITMDILYNKYYFELSSDENDHSVCTMFNYNDRHFMFTGDLEENGEKAMAAYYDASTSEKTLPEVELFKAGHHGSKTSSNDCLLNIIKPEICCVCCCAGSSEYTNVNDNTFPTQEFINRISKHTDRVYVTSLLNASKTRETNTNVFESFNGTIIVSSNGDNIGLSASNNLVKLKDSNWFNELIYVKVNNNGYNIIFSGLKQKDYFISTDSGVSQIPRRVWPN